MASLLVILLGGCATLPSSGPTGREIRRAAAPSDGAVGFEIVPLSDLSALPAEPASPIFALPPAVSGPTNLIGTGDVLEISVYEAGVTLFGGAASLAAAGGSTMPGAQVERLPAFRVDNGGNIHIPFVGQIQASGRTTSELESEIRVGLRGMSENPQVLVSIRETVGNSVILSGEVSRPGRLPLPTNQETLLDVIALAGGYRGEAKDLSVKVQRQGVEQALRLSDLQTSRYEDFRIQPGDRISITQQPRSFSVMGAPSRVQQIPFPTPVLSLTEALAQAGGSNPNLGDPKAIFIFRFVQDAEGQEKPVVYHIDMMDPRAFFVSQRFAMHDKDLLYVGNAAANQPSKFIQILSQLFTPVILARQLAD